MGEKRISIKDFLTRLKSSKKPLEEVDKIVENENLAALIRRKYLEEKLGLSLSATGSSILDFVELEGKISYKPIGAIQVPVTVIGPIRIDGTWIRAEKLIPLASIYPALMRSVELGAKLLEDTRIRIKINRCWLRIFTISTPGKRVDLCSMIEKKLLTTETYSDLRIICYGRGAGHIINTVMIGDQKPCIRLLDLIESNIFKEILLETQGSLIPIITPYIVFDMSASTDISKNKIEDLGIKYSMFMESYNTIEDLKPIDNSLLPVILGVLTSFYLSIGLKPEYALRSEVKQYMVSTRFRKININVNPRIILPVYFTYDEMTLMNKEIFNILQINEPKPNYLAELIASLLLVSYIGLLGDIAKNASQE